MFTPAAASLATSARFCGSSAKLRTDAATTGPDVRNGLQLPRPAPPGSPSIVRRCRASVAAAFSPTWRMPSAYTSRDRSFCLLRSICSTTLRPTLPSFRGTARSERGSRGVTTRFSSCAASSAIEIGEVAHQPLLDQLIDQRLAQPFDVHRAARREVLEAPAQPRRTGRVLAAPDDFFFVALQRAAARLARRRHHPGRRVRRAGG